MQLRRGAAEDPCDAGSGGEQVGGHWHAEMADFFADQQRVASLAGQGIDQGGDVLIGRELLLNGQHIVRVLPAIGVDEIVEILGIAERREGHGFTS